MHRRDFLKLMATLPLVRISWRRRALGPFPNAEAQTEAADAHQPNILILLFDTFSAKHASLYGYPRHTTPHLERFAERATVYHAHQAAGNYTNPGTGSLLTGTYPWKHRSLQLYSPIIPPYVDKNLFRALGDPYHSVTYTHNLVAGTMIYQFLDDLDNFKKTKELCLYDGQLADQFFFNDYDLATWRERIFRGAADLSTYPSSIFYLLLNKEHWQAKRDAIDEQYREQFPLGVPSHHDQVFLLEDAMDWLRDNLEKLPQPFIVYFHLSPPHAPYRPSKEFVGRFDGGWQPTPKPEHIFTQGRPHEELAAAAQNYDEYVAFVDSEFGRYYDHFHTSPLSDNTYLLVTSDHGEIFERGIWGHLTEVLYDPLVRVPLLISAPGQQERRDIHTPTSAVDVMPTLLHLADRPIPAWCEGKILPPYQTTAVTNEERSIFAVEAKSNHKMAPLTRVSIAMIKGRYKLIHYRGYENLPEGYELYDLEADPEELNDIYATASIAAGLKEELLAKLEEVNADYR